VPCRLGTKQLLDIVTDIAEGKGSPQDIELLIELCEGIKLGSLCGLGQTVCNPLLSSMRYFPEEYDAHIIYRSCPRGVCKPMNSLRLRQTR
jgi:NADH-quinone oxidoreductase subunit F